MIVTLTPNQATMVRGKVASGKYSSENAVIDEALRLLQQQDQTYQDWVREVNERIEEGLEELRQGKSISGEQAFQELREHSKKRRQEMQGKP